MSLEQSQADNTHTRLYQALLLNFKSQMRDIPIKILSKELSKWQARTTINFSVYKVCSCCFHFCVFELNNKTQNIIALIVKINQPRCKVCKEWFCIPHPKNAKRSIFTQQGDQVQSQFGKLVFCLVVNSSLYYASGARMSHRQYLQDKTMKVLKMSLPQLNSSLVLLKPQLLLLHGRYESN